MSGRRRHSRAAFKPAVLTDGREAGTLILRDQSRMKFSRVLPEDAEYVRAFLERLTKAEKEEIANSLRMKWEALPAFLDDLGEKEKGGAFLVQGERDEKVVAFGAYKLLAGVKDAAGIGVAVTRHLRKMGIGALLIERLTVLAARNGVGRLVGVSTGEVKPLIGLFRSSGFEPDVRKGERSTSFLISTRAALNAPGSGRRTSSRTFVASSLRSLFHPRSVAVLGTFKSSESLGHRILWNLVEHGFNGPVFPVNPRTQHVLSIRAYPSIEAIGEPVDLAVLVIRFEEIPAAIKSCAAAGVKAVVVVSAGYSEAGEEGRERERKLVDLVERHGIRMIGPNTMGIIRSTPDVSLNASFSPLMPEPGAAALCSHSGALGIAITALSKRIGLGLSTFVSVGNRADVSGNDLLEFWEEDENTRVILFYIESFKNPRRFARLARRVGRSKPIITVKAGRSEAGRRAAPDGGMLATNIAVDAFLSQTGVISADSLEEMFEIACALTEQPLPQGRRVAVVTDAGGPAILCVDALERGGMRVEALSEETQARLQRLLPEGARTRNPVDMLTLCGPECYRSAVECVLAAEEVDALVVIYTPVGVAETDRVGEAITGAVATVRAQGVADSKPVLVSMVGVKDFNPMLATGKGERIPVYHFPEAIGRLLGKVSNYAEWRRSDPGVFPEFDDQHLPRVLHLCEQAFEKSGGGWLSHADVRVVLEGSGLVQVPGAVAKSADEAKEIACDLGFPVVAKIGVVDRSIRVHEGGVVLDLKDADAVGVAYDQLCERFAEDLGNNRADGVLVRSMVEQAAEVIVRVHDDPRFGPLVTFGLGGDYVEVMADVSHRVSPLTHVDAAAMIRQVRGFPLLQGYRGHPQADLQALEGVLLRVSRLVEAVPHIVEIDFGPLFAFPPGQGCTIADARIRIG